MKRIVLLTTLALGLSSLGTLAQNTQPQVPPGNRPPPGENGPPPGGPFGRGGPGRPGFRPPLMEVLDANHDGIIDADEIANASNALKKLDKNNDGKITPDEYRPPGRGPAGPRGGGFGPGDRPRPPRPPDE
jgi:EF hand